MLSYEAMKLTHVCARVDSSNPAAVAKVKRLLLSGLQSMRKAVSLDDMGLDREADELSLQELGRVLVRSVSRKDRDLDPSAASAGKILGVNGKTLPKTITFPFSRHSSFEELRHLVGIFRPRDVFPCTVDETKWHQGSFIS